MTPFESSHFPSLIPWFQCFGLLGANGAGKSTIFAMLSGELAPTSGTIHILNRDNGIAYCPQTNPLDNLLTVQEIMYFYGQLRRIKNIHEVSSLTLCNQSKWKNLFNTERLLLLRPFSVKGFREIPTSFPFDAVSTCVGQKPQRW